MSGDLKITALQAALKDLGYDPGTIDGINGKKTRAAATAFGQGAKTSLPVSGTTTKPSSAKGVIYQGAAKHLVDEIVVHCSATTKSWANGKTNKQMFDEIKSWHVKDNGWSDIGYQWVIFPDGSILAGRPETTIGAGVAGHNSGVIHCCLIGGHGSAETDEFDQHFTAAQKKSLLALLRSISSRTPITRISGHNEWAAKACPGFNVPNFLKENQYE